MIGEEFFLLDVDDQNLAGAELACLEELSASKIQDAVFGRRHDQAAFQERVAHRAQSVAVHKGAYPSAVVEGDRRRAVPGFHQTGEVAVELSPVFRHVFLRHLFPDLGHHHQKTRQEGAPPPDQEFQDVVESARVGHRVVDNGSEAYGVVRSERVLSGSHPVFVSLQGVELTVVGHEPVGVG